MKAKAFITFALLFFAWLANAQATHEVKEVDGKAVIVQTVTQELTSTSAELDKEITKIDAQIKALTEQKNVLLDILRKVRAIEDKNKPSAEVPKENKEIKKQ